MSEKATNLDNSLTVNQIKVKDIVDYLERVKSSIISQQHLKMCDEMNQLEKDLEQCTNNINEMKRAEQDIEIELQRKRSQLEAINDSIADCQEHQIKLGKEVKKIQHIITDLKNRADDKIEHDKKLKELQNHVLTEQLSLQQRLKNLKNKFHSAPQVQTDIGPDETSSLILNITKSLTENSGDCTNLIKEIGSKILEESEPEKADKPLEASTTDKTVYPQSGTIVEMTEVHPQEEHASNIIERLKETLAGTKSNKVINKLQESNGDQLETQRSNTVEPPKEQPKEPLKAEEIHSSTTPQQTLTQQMEAEYERMQKQREEMIERIRCKSSGVSTQGSSG